MSSSVEVEPALSRRSRRRGTADAQERLIRPATRRVGLRDLPATVPVIRVLVSRDIKVRYQQSVVGPVWLLFQPIALLAAYLITFRGLGHVSDAGVPYAVFALCGLSVWSFFSSSMTMGAAAMISNMNLVRSTPCPRFAPFASSLVSSLPSYVITGLAAVVGTAVTGDLSARIVLLPVTLAWLLVLTLAVVTLFGTLAVWYRDVLQALPFVMQIAAFVTPVGYAPSALSPTLRLLIDLNPVTGLLELQRWVILRGYGFDPTAVVISAMITAGLVIFSWRLFTRRETTMADVL